jgi:DNA-binding transcriptional MerR regulator
MAETKIKTLLTIKPAARFLGVAENTLRSWESAGVIPVGRHPKNNYRLFAVADLEKIRGEIQATGTYPTGWQRPRRPR